MLILSPSNSVEACFKKHKDDEDKREAVARTIQIPSNIFGQNFRPSSPGKKTLKELIIDKLIIDTKTTVTQSRLVSVD